MCVCVCMHACIHTHMQAYMHTYIYIYYMHKRDYDIVRFPDISQCTYVCVYASGYIYTAPSRCLQSLSFSVTLFSCRAVGMSERPEWGKHFYLDSQLNQFVCMTCGLCIRRSTDEVKDDPEAVHQKLDIDCRRIPTTDGPHIPSSSGRLCVTRFWYNYTGTI